MPYLPDHLVHGDQWSAITYREIIKLRETIMAQIDRLEALIKSEVGEALATMQQRVDDALAAADASDAERAAVEAEFETFQGRVDNLADRVQEEGLFGQDEESPEEPVAPEPEPTEPDPDGDDTSPPPSTDPGSVTF